MIDAVKTGIKRVLAKSFVLSKAVYSIRYSFMDQQIRSGGVAPVLMGIELTNKCPFSCIMCVRTEGMTREQGFMSDTLFKKIIDDYVAQNPVAARTKELTFTHFGESLLHPKFSEMIRYAVDSGCGKTLLSINPLMLTAQIQQKLLNSGIHKIHFSMDGHDDESFFAIRGVKDAYEASKANLLEFVSLVRSERKPIYLRLGMVDFDLNRSSILRMLDFWKKAGLDEVWVKPAEAWSGTVASVNAAVKYTPRHDGVKIVPTCPLPFYGLTVTYDGEVVACCADHNDIMVLGNLNSQTLRQVFLGPAYQALRAEFLSGSVTNKLCSSCAWLGNQFGN